MDCLCLTKFSFLRPRDEESRRNKNVHKSINFMKAEKKYILRETEQRNLRVRKKWERRERERERDEKSELAVMNCPPFLSP